ncbi:MAG: PAC2 family protein [Candidatus Micrarchaeia archaeon]
MKTHIVAKKVKLHNPILLVGLPGIGNVGSLVVQYLIQQLNAKEFAQLYSQHFPYLVIVTPDGGHRLVSNRFFYYKNPNKKGNDLVLLIGDYQPATSEGQYEVNDMIVKFFKSLGGKEVYTIGGYSAEARIIQNPRVFGVTNNKSLKERLSKLGVMIGATPNLSIIGAAGLVMAFADRAKMPSACIMGETGLLEVDANAARSVLQLLVKMFDLKINLNELVAIQHETEKLIKELEEAAGKEGAPKVGEHPNYIR